MLGGSEPAILLGRATVALATGRVDDAVVLAESARALAGAAHPTEVPIALVLGWARVAQGHPELALSLLEGVAAPMSHADYRAQLELLRAAATARTGAIAEGRALIDAVDPPSARWWEPTRRVVSALVDAAGGASVDAEALGRELEAGPLHLVARFAQIALRSPPGA
jgi:hypothetical protein